MIVHGGEGPAWLPTCAGSARAGLAVLWARADEMIVSDSERAHDEVVSSLLSSREVVDLLRSTASRFPAPPSPTS
jgi:hypothetical protein